MTTPSNVHVPGTRDRVAWLEPDRHRRTVISDGDYDPIRWVADEMRFQTMGFAAVDHHGGRMDLQA